MNSEEIWERALKVARREFRRLKREDVYGSFHPSHHASDALLKAEEYLRKRGENGTFGVEGNSIPDNDFMSRDHRSCMYLNGGDTYAATIIWDGQSEQFHIGCWGDWQEEAELDYQEDTNTHRCGYCGHFTPRIEDVDWHDTICESCGHTVDGGDTIDVYVIEDWAGNKPWPDKEFKTFEDAWEFLYQLYPPTEEDNEREELQEFEVVTRKVAKG